MFQEPDYAHKVWEKSTPEEREAALNKMQNAYGEDWVDEFLTLQSSGFRGEGVENFSFGPGVGPSSEELAFQGYVRRLRFPLGTGGTFAEEWIRPSGSFVRVIRENQPPDLTELTPAPQPDEIIDDLDEIEALLGHPVPEFEEAILSPPGPDGTRQLTVKFGGSLSLRTACQGGVCETVRYTSPKER
ncbi:MAG: hypothetical protein F6K04_22245, partial [Leptolyngbya sp. SIO4C5]|nr:hypothetical protein [Leptolyngbya sp. SIO4C5]